MLISSWNMRYQSGKPVQGIENFSGFSVLRCVNNFGNTIIGFQIFQNKYWCSLETAILQKTSICSYGVEMRIAIEKVTVRLHSDAGAWDSIIIWYSGFQIGFNNIPCTFGEFCQYFAVIEKINPQTFGNTATLYKKGPLPVRNIL